MRIHYRFKHASRWRVLNFADTTVSVLQIKSKLLKPKSRSTVIVSDAQSGEPFQDAHVFRRPNASLTIRVVPRDFDSLDVIQHEFSEETKMLEVMQKDSNRTTLHRTNQSTRENHSL